MTTFHSRRIGQRPGRLALQEGDTLIQQPEQTTILGATKVTGKASGWTYGGLTALTDREYATVDATTVDRRVERTERLIEPYTSFNVGRVQRDVFGGSSNVGAIGTAVVREKDLDAYTGRIDYYAALGQEQVQLERPLGRHARADRRCREERFRRRHQLELQGKHLGIFGHFDHFDRDYKNTDIGFFASRNNKTAVDAGLNIGQPDPSKYPVMPSCS